METQLPKELIENACSAPVDTHRKSLQHHLSDTGITDVVTRRLTGGEISSPSHPYTRYASWSSSIKVYHVFLPMSTRQKYCSKPDYL